MTGTDDFLARLEDYLDMAEGSTPLPDAVRDAVRAELPATRQLGPPRGPMRIFAMAAQLPRSSRYVLAVAVVAVALIGATSLIVGAFRSIPSPTPTPATSGQSAVVDDLIASWNSGDGLKTASLYTNYAWVGVMIDNPNFVDGLYADADVEAAVKDWHDTGSTLTRTGEVVTQGPFAAAPVTWTSPDGSFDGVEVVRISGDGLVSEHYLVGATSSPGGAPQVDATKLVHDLRDADNASDGSAGAPLLAPTAQGSAVRDGSLFGGFASPDDYINAVNQGTACCETDIGSIQTQGPFIVHAAVLTNAQFDPGKEIEGIDILELNGDGLIQTVWRFDTKIDLPGTQAPAASGG